MKKITLEELKGLSAYEAVRERFRQEIIEHKKNRRLAVGDRLSLLFEDRKTVIFQIQEMIRTEKITNLDKIREEVEVYNSLIPERDELSATMFLEIEDQADIRKELTEMIGVDESISLEMDSERVPGIVEPGRKTEEKISAVQYVRFHFTPLQKETFVRGTEEVYVVSDHPQYKQRVCMPENVRASLSQDLASN
jgi:hypothetical protein